MRPIFCRLMHWIVVHWPASVERTRLGGRLFFAMLPWAGEWAHYWSESPEYRRQLDQSR